MKKLKIQIDEKNQISQFMLDHLMPTQMRGHWDAQLKINFYLQPLIQTIDLIMNIGELEHTHDWDPYLHINLTTQDEPIITEHGYYTMTIEGHQLIIEDQDEIHHILIPSIQSISLER